MQYTYAACGSNAFRDMSELFLTDRYANAILLDFTSEIGYINVGVTIIQICFICIQD